MRDESLGELKDYYKRIYQWYAQGGFFDEHEEWHSSPYHFDIPIWEVLNEVEFEHKMTPEQYTERYDAIVAAIHKVSPETKFMGMALILFCISEVSDLGWLRVELG